MMLLSKRALQIKQWDTATLSFTLIAHIEKKILITDAYE